MTEKSFNLIDEPWIPVTGSGKVSLAQIFSNPDIEALGGNPVQKISLLKLLLAIAQSACTPKDESELKEIGVQGLQNLCLDYLNKWHDRFNLYGDKPFLQMPAIKGAEIKGFGAVLPEISAGNTSVLSQVQIEKKLDDAEKALLILTLMGFALGGKQTDNSIVLSPNYGGKRNDKGKPSSGKSGPAISYRGSLHSFLLDDTIAKTLWLNVLTKEQLDKANMFPEGVGIAPWERMPGGEDCAQAKKLKGSLLGRLIPLCRFCLLADSGLHYSEGIVHPDYKDGVTDPSVSVNYADKQPRILWVDPEKRPWRELTSLLTYLSEEQEKGFSTLQLQNLDRARDLSPRFAIWSGGLKVRSTVGEQKVSGNDDFVESQVWLQSEDIDAKWFANLRTEVSVLNSLNKNLCGKVKGYFNDQKLDGKELVKKASQLFWQLCERDFQGLIDCCSSDSKGTQLYRQTFGRYVHKSYNQFCPNETARQLDAWAKNQPNIKKHLSQEA